MTNMRYLLTRLISGEGPDRELDAPNPLDDAELVNRCAGAIMSCDWEDENAASKMARAVIAAIRAELDHVQRQRDEAIKGTALRWQVKQRMDFITAHLAEHGWIGRAPLIVKFDLSVSQASNDLTMYRALHPHAIQYDAHLKRYVRQPFDGRWIAAPHWMPLPEPPEESTDE